MKDRIYLDYNATAPLRPEALCAMTDALKAPHNASSVHGYGREGRKIIEDARIKIAALVNAPPAQVIFNSGATEGNNTVLKHFAGERILVSAIEHPSVLEAAPGAEKIPITRKGIVDLDALEEMLKTNASTVCAKEGPPALVSVMLVNNETGAIQPIEKISGLAHSHGALFHCDAVQAAGRIPIDIQKLGADFLTLSAHKIGGPQGAGALVLGLCGVTPILLDGGGQEKKARAGTENVAAIAGFGAAAEAALRDLEPSRKKMEDLRAKLESTLGKDAGIHAANAPRVANTSMFSLPGASAETLLMAFDLESVALSNGSACSSGTVRASHVLKAMGVDDALAASAIRVSMGWNTKESDIDAFLAAWKKIGERLSKKKAVA